MLSTRDFRFKDSYVNNNNKGEVAILMSDQIEHKYHRWQLISVSCLGNPMDRRTWWATVHGVTKELGTT